MEILLCTGVIDGCMKLIDENLNILIFASCNHQSRVLSECVMAFLQSLSVSARTAMASDVNYDCDYCEESVIARGQTPPPPATLEDNVLQPEKDFILLFETLTELWDTTNPQYTNKYKRNENLAKLLPILKKIKPNATVEDVKKKINSLRSNYRRELKKITLSRRSGAATEDIYTPKIWYFPYLHFLRRIEQPVSLQEWAPTHQQHTASDTEEMSQQSGQQTRDTEKRTFSSISSVSKPLVSSTTKKKKITQNELLNRACKFLSEPCSSTDERVKLPNPIALEWSNTLDKLEPMQKIFAKKAINDILFEAELGNLNKNSVRINDPTSSPPQMTHNTTQNFSPYTCWSSSSPSYSTLTSPPPPSPESQQIALTPTPPPISQQTNPQKTGPVARTILRHYSSSNDPTVTSPPPPPSPTSQQIALAPTPPPISQQTNPQQTGPVTRTILPHYSSSYNSSLISPPPPPSPTSQLTPMSQTHSSQQQTDSVQRGSASEIILSSNHPYDHQTPISHSNEYILHIVENSTQSSTNYQDISSLFSQFK